VGIEDKLAESPPCHGGDSGGSTRRFRHVDKNHIQGIMSYMEYRLNSSSHKLFKDKCIDCKEVMWRRPRAFGTRCRHCARSHNIKKLHGFGKDNPNWKGGRSMHAKGYVLVKVDGHPRATKKGYVLEHIIVAEKMLGRKLKSNEQVHHRNEIKDDNRRKNLQVMTASEHARHHKATRDDKVFCSAGCGVARYSGKNFVCVNCTRPSVAKVKAAYKKHGSWRKAADFLGISHEAARGIYLRSNI